MIFVITDDRILHVHHHPDEDWLQGEYEGINVENGEYQFFDERGRPLAAEFYESNRQGGGLLGCLSWVQSGKYHLVLVPTKESCGSTLLEILDSITGIEKNPHFSDLREVRRGEVKSVIAT